MFKSVRGVWIALIIVCSGGFAHAAATFKPHELFRIPFGTSREALGARVEGGQFLFPRVFAMDAGGHFYIYDSLHHRIARYSSAGRYEMEFRYPETARQVFAHPDSKENLWLLISDPAQGMFYGVYDAQGKRLNAGIFSRFNDFHLHLDDDGLLHVTLTSSRDAGAVQTYVLDEKSLLMKKENIAPPPDDHHQVRQREHLYFVDAVPGAKETSQASRITDQSHHTVAEIQGKVIYVTDAGELYTRVGDRQINVYDVSGSRIGRVQLAGLSSACAAIRFDTAGNLYELDGVPDQSDDQIRRGKPPANTDFEDLHYTPAMTGMRLIRWERQ